ncbi:hypothetical protein DESC_500117 [Desulfosarcina cetonica]|nr:hypothetical protein DESC_500117 [Desulfosarcina cetonica]
MLSNNIIPQSDIFYMETTIGRPNHENDGPVQENGIYQSESGLSGSDRADGDDVAHHGGCGGAVFLQQARSRCLRVDRVSGPDFDIFPSGP